MQLIIMQAANKIRLKFEFNDLIDSYASLIYTFLCSYEKLNKEYLHFLGFLCQLAGVSDQRHLTQILAGQVKSLLSCKHCTFFMADRDSQQIFTFVCKLESKRQEPVFEEIRFPMTRHSIVGYVALTGESLLLQVQTVRSLLSWLRC